MQPCVYLIDVERIYADLFHEWCESRDIPSRVFDGQPGSFPGRVGLCVLSISANGDDAFERIRGVFKAMRGAPFVVLLRNPEVDLVVRLVRMGVSDVIGVPAPPRGVVASSMRHFADSGERQDGETFVGQTPAIRELRARLAHASASRSTVLIEGETGTGKGVLARRIHDRSDLRRGPFVHVDCAALSPTLIESELFGHEKGAFTGADSMRRGRFETAAEGTIFLDEIGDLDARLQTKLLRVLGDRVFERVGGTQAWPMRARVIAATSHDLLRAVSEKRFRADLYFRLNVLHFVIPPLRERLQDLPLLVQSGLSRLSGTLGVPLPRVSEEFCDHLGDHHWPGNVRELMNLLERILVNRRGDVLLPEDIDAFLARTRPSAPQPAEPDALVPDLLPDLLPGASSEDQEAEMIAAALRDTGGNIARTARRLGVPRGTLRYRIKKFGLSDLIPRD